MNCCDEHDCVQGRSCTRRAARRHAFAPGVIEHHAGGLLGNQAQRRELLRWAKRSACWLLACGVGGLAAGLIVGVIAGLIAGVWP